MRQLEFGDLVVSLTVSGPDDFFSDDKPSRRIRVDRADPRILVSFDVWQAWRNGRDVPFVDLQLAPGCVPGAPIDSAIGSTVLFSAENGQWLYRVTGCNFGRRVLELTWPD